MRVASLPDLQLASKSPRRRSLLSRAGLTFELCEPGVEYEPGQSEHGSHVGEPAELARARARRKAVGAQAPSERAPILAVDTVVDLAGVELGKAADREGAAALLRRLSGSRHRVHTAHCLLWPQDRNGGFVELCSATVVCDVVTQVQLDSYLDSEQWRGKAGAYGIQDEAQDFLHIFEGAFDTVVGLHVPAVLRLLAAAKGQS